MLPQEIKINQIIEERNTYIDNACNGDEVNVRLRKMAIWADELDALYEEIDQ